MGWAVRCGGESSTYINTYYSYSISADFTFEIDMSRRGEVSNSSNRSRLFINDNFTAGFYIEGQYLASNQIGYITLLPHLNGERFTLKIQRVSGILRVYKNGMEIHSRVSGEVFNNLYKVGQGPTGIDVHRVLLNVPNLGTSFNAVASLSNGTGNVVPYQSSSPSITVPLQLVNPQPSNGSWVPVVDPITGKPLKYWNGSAWVTKPLKYWNGSAWVEKPLKYHNGTSWS